MRVRISYSVDLEEVPSESHRMLKQGVEELDKICKALSEHSTNIKEGNLSEERTLLVLQDLRKKMMAVDFKLADNIMILTGYHAAKNQPAEQAEQEPPKEKVDVNERWFS